MTLYKYLKIISSQQAFLISESEKLKNSALMLP